MYGRMTPARITDPAIQVPPSALADAAVSRPRSPVSQPWAALGEAPPVPAEHPRLMAARLTDRVADSPRPGGRVARDVGERGAALAPRGVQEPPRARRALAGDERPQ